MGREGRIVQSTELLVRFPKTEDAIVGLFLLYEKMREKKEEMLRGKVEWWWWWCWVWRYKGA
jgi:hypothetical protein